MAEANLLHGSCACERNQYTIVIPTTTTTNNNTSSDAQVFFDNSAENRRSQATPVTAWLRIPLAWYQSTTHAYFPDETHATIRRTFHTASRTRRQFCGYCGTHLTAWNERRQQQDAGSGVLDVTVGSLGGESVERLEELGFLSSEEEEEEEEEGGEEMSGVEGPGMVVERNRGMPFFEEMVEEGRLGRRIRRQKGGGVSGDGRTRVQWEVVEMEGGEEEEPEMGERNKRPRLDA